MANSTETGRDRLAILKAVKTPLSFFTVALLIAEGILATLAYRATGSDFTLLLRATVAMPFMLIMVVAVQFRSRVSPAARSDTINTYKYDAFVSVPMGAVNDEEYVQLRNLAQGIVVCLQQECGKKSVYYAGANIASKAEFEPNDVSVQDDLEAISLSEYFIMVYPAKLVSSVLFEAGYAVALNKKSLYFVRSRHDLPFVMQHAEQAFAAVKLYNYNDTNGVISVLKNRKCFEFKKFRRDSSSNVIG